MRQIIKTETGYHLMVAGEEIIIQYESVAAWYTRIRLDPGVYPYVPTDINGQECLPERAYYMAIRIPGTIVESFHPPLFGGVMYPGSKEYDESRIGERTHDSWSTHAYQFPDR